LFPLAFLFKIIFSPCPIFGTVLRLYHQFTTTHYLSATKKRKKDKNVENR
jgi:hypothetical protein